jgi:hypothetical protein
MRQYRHARLTPRHQARDGSAGAAANTCATCGQHREHAAVDAGFEAKTGGTNIWHAQHTGPRSPILAIDGGPPRAAANVQNLKERRAGGP